MKTTIAALTLALGMLAGLTPVSAAWSGPPLGDPDATVLLRIRDTGEVPAAEQLDECFETFPCRVVACPDWVQPSMYASAIVAAGDPHWLDHCMGASRDYFTGEVTVPDIGLAVTVVDPGVWADHTVRIVDDLTVEFVFRSSRFELLETRDDIVDCARSFACQPRVCTFDIDPAVVAIQDNEFTSEHWGHPLFWRWCENFTRTPNFETLTGRTTGRVYLDGGPVVPPAFPGTGHKASSIMGPQWLPGEPVVTADEITVDEEPTEAVPVDEIADAKIVFTG